MWLNFEGMKNPTKRSHAILALATGTIIAIEVFALRYFVSDESLGSAISSAILVPLFLGIIIYGARAIRARNNLDS
jgi:hypothetical protein